MHPTLLYYWHRTPMLRHTLALSMGILFQSYASASLLSLSVMAALGAGALLLIFYCPDSLRRKSTFLSLLASSLLFFSAGAWLYSKADIRNNPNWLGRSTPLGSDDVWEYVVEEEPIEKTKTYKVRVSAQRRYHDNQRLRVAGNLYLYLQKDSQAHDLQPGDTVWTMQTPLAIEPPKNPGERNGQQEQLRKGITHRSFLQAGDYRIGANRSTLSLKKMLISFRRKILHQIQLYIQDPMAAGLAEALLIGYRQDLDPALSRAYSNTGVIHVIAISGMHLALLGGVLSWCLQPLSRWQPLKRWMLLLILGLLWLFSLLAGGAPSILRATLLFSCVTGGEWLQRKGNSFNTLMASAFLLLCYNPFWLWDLGFQLSFSAVGGILLVGRTLSRWCSHSKIWWHAPGQLVATSIAAQLFTTPLSLYHFHQFPGAFLLSNLIAVPLSSIVLVTLLLLITCSPFPSLATWIGQGVELLISLMNQYIQWVESIPGLLFTDLNWRLSETVLLSILLLAGSHWVINKSRIGSIVTLGMSLLLVGMQAINRSQQANQHLLVVYHFPYNTAIDLISGSICYSRTDEDPKKENHQLYYTLSQSRNFWGIKTVIPLAYHSQLQTSAVKIWFADKHHKPPLAD